VKKTLLGREGQNVAIYNNKGVAVAERKGAYGQYASIYQKYAQLPRDQRNNYYQPSVYYMCESCGLGFRRQNHLIVDEDAEFIGHYLSD